MPLDEKTIELTDAERTRESLAKSAGIRPSVWKEYTQARAPRAVVPESSTGVIGVYGPVTPYAREMREWEGMDAVSFADVRTAVEALPEDSNLEFRINSPGGVVSEATAIMALMDRAKKDGRKVKAVVEGVAASAGAMIFLAADERLMSRYGRLMYHYSTVAMIVVGNANMLDKEAKAAISSLRSFDEIMERDLQRITGMDAEAVASMLENEEFFNAETALETGLATGMEVEADIENSAGVSTVVQNDSFDSTMNLLEVLGAINSGRT